MNAAPDQLRAFVERVERLEEEIAALNKDKSEVYAEAKGNGFDVPTIKKIVRIRKLDHAERLEQDALLDLYMSALGMIPADEPSHVRVHEGDSSTAARMDVHSGGLGLRSEDASQRIDQPEAAGTQAPPVETTAPEAPASAGEAVDATPLPRPVSHEDTSSQRPAREAEANAGGDHEGIAKTLIDRTELVKIDLAAGAGSSAGGSSVVSASDVEPVAPFTHEKAA